MKTSRINIFFIVAAILSSITACTHKEIMYPDSGMNEIKIKFMWDSVCSELPDGMTLYFFPLWSDGKIWRYDISGHEGGSVELPAGSYSMLAYNNDLPGITASGFTALDLCTASVNIANGVASATGPLYSAAIESLEVTPCGVEYAECDGQHKVCPMGLVRCCPQPRYCNYTVIMKNVSGIEHVRKATVMLGGMAVDLNLASGETGDASVPLAIAMDQDKAVGGFSGSSTSFGLCRSDARINAILHVVRADGTVMEKTYDVTSQVVNAPDPRNVVVVIDNVDIPSTGGTTPPAGDNVGIDVDVEGWIVINIDIETNSNN